jgi:hypothetical protein
VFFEFLIKVLEIYSSGLSFFNKFTKMNEDNPYIYLDEQTDEEIYSQLAEELGVSLEYYLMEFV